MRYDDDHERNDERVALSEQRLLGGRLSLDFANTVDPRHGKRPHELLASSADLVRWAAHAGAIDAHDMDRLFDYARRQPRAAAAVLDAAHRLRDELYRVFSSVAAALPPAPPDLEALNRGHATAMVHARVVVTSDGYRWEWDDKPPELGRVLWPVVRDAADLLTRGRLERIRECPGADGCGWLFYDTSRNGRRRWCSMEGCGNRSKARRHYRRHAPALTHTGSPAHQRDPAMPPEHPARFDHGDDAWRRPG